MTLRGSTALLAGAPLPVALDACACGAPLPSVHFDPRDANEPAEVVRRRWPRGDGACPRCGVRSIRYASAEHFIAGDW